MVIYVLCRLEVVDMYSKWEFAKYQKSGLIYIYIYI